MDLTRKCVYELGMVTFNYEVTIYGERSKAPQVVTGDKLFNYDFLLDNGTQQAATLLQKPIKDSAKVLSDKLMSLESNCPWTWSSFNHRSCSASSPGSSVILCTDGLANIGLGAFDEVKSAEQQAQTEAFYKRLGEFAKSKGISVSIISIIGDECNIDTLGRLAELTGGSVERVDPINLLKTSQTSFNSL